MNEIYENLKKMTQNYRYMTEELETIRVKITLNFQQQKSLAKLGGLSLNENNLNFVSLIKKYENFKTKVNIIYFCCFFFYIIFLFLRLVI